MNRKRKKEEKQKRRREDDENGEIEEMLNWIDERFLKSLARLHCLALIARGHTHGYDIMKYIKEQYDLKISAGSCYPILQWLEDKKYIKGVWECEEGKPSKKTYKITPKGRKVLEAARKRLLALVSQLSARG
jgi:DNA-binding PadR family transcriptional regulator